MKKTRLIERFAATLVCLIAFTSATLSQTTEFTFQGRLTTLGLPAVIDHDMRFRIFDAATGGEQIGETLTRSNVHLSLGVYNVQLDFGAEPFPGGDRWIEVSASPAGLNIYTTMLRQKLTSVPHAIRSRSVSLADDSLKLGGIDADQYVLTTDPRLEGLDPANFVQNSSAPQPGAHFNIGGTGSANVLNAATQFSIGGNRILSAAGINNLFAGFSAGISNTTGTGNSFVGGNSGANNATGNYNSFFGLGSGLFNTVGSDNSFFGISSGANNELGNHNSFFGAYAGRSNFANSGNSYFGSNAGAGSTGEKNSFFGAAAGSSAGVGAGNRGSNNAFFGYRAGTSNTADNNAFFGYESGRSNTTGFQNSFFGAEAGLNNSTGSFNSFFGRSSGFNNSTGSGNSFFGQDAGLANTTGGSNAFFGNNSGLSNTTGTFNSFFGLDAGRANTTGTAMALFGFGAGKANTIGIRNAFFGVQAGLVNSTGGSNTFVGTESGFRNTTGGLNTFFGESAGAANTTGSSLTVIGAYANVGANNLAFATAIGAGTVVDSSNTLVLGRAADTVQIPGTLTLTANFSTSIFNATTQYNIGGNRILSNAGTDNLFAGVEAGDANTLGTHNTFVGRGAGRSNTTAFRNTFFGAFAGEDTTTGSFNSFFGYFTGQNTTTGTGNSFFGYHAGANSTTGIRNTFIGGDTGTLAMDTQVSNSTAIGYGAKVSESNTIVLGTTAETTIARGHFRALEPEGQFVPGVRTFDLNGTGIYGLIASNLVWRGGALPFSEFPVCFWRIGIGEGDGGQALTYCFDANSSSANKSEIKPFTGGLEIVNRLNPVTFKRKEDGKSEVGLNADDVAEVAPQLVTRNENDEVESVKKGSLDVLFINGIKEQQKQIEAQQRQIDALKKLVCQSNPQAEMCREGQK